MSNTTQILDDVRAQLAPEDLVLKEARARRDAVRSAAQSFTGATRTFSSGSLAHATANCPVHQRDVGLDADAGVVLDRRTWNALGPDSEQRLGPASTVERLKQHLMTKLLSEYSGATFEVTKRAILISFSQPLPSGEDPTVDLMMGLERAGKPGLWIPNTEVNSWDPSHPEKHTELLTAEPKALRVTRARAVRLAKAENKRTPTPPLCSFNIEALGLMFVRTGMTVPEALLAIWQGGAADLAQRLTPDPAEVSASIKVAERGEAVARLTEAADRLASAIAHDHDERRVRQELAPLWPDFISAHLGGATKARLVAASRSRQSFAVTSTGLLTTGAGATLKQPRSFGDVRRG